MTHRPQEALQIARVDVVVSPVVDRAERLLHAVIVSVFQRSFHQVSLQVHPDLLKNELANCPFDTHRQELVPRQLVVRSLSNSCSQVGIIAGQKQLQEVVVVEQIIPIQVEILNHLLEIFRLKLAIAVLSLELGQRCRIDVSSVLSINTLEGCVWFEVSHRREYLPQPLDCNLLLSSVHQQFLYFQF